MKLYFFATWALLCFGNLESKHIQLDERLQKIREASTSLKSTKPAQDVEVGAKELVDELVKLGLDQDQDIMQKLLEVKKPEPTYLNVPEMVTQHGYPIESHNVVTQDGYILTLHRIPYGKNNNGKNKKKTRQPIFLQHGLLASSSCWLLNTSDIAPGYIFADHGYDVWLGNARGNEYSKAHMTLDSTSEAFWDFSWTEMGKYDIPASIDFILNITKYEKLIYVGHSMGTSMFWAAMNEHPSYNEKILVMFGLGPVAYVNHMISPIRHFSFIAPYINGLAHLVGIYEFLPDNVVFKVWTKYMCSKLVIEEFLCKIGIFFLTGFDSRNFDLDLMPLVASQLNSGTSLNTVNHFAQEYEAGKFQRYDHGYYGNLKKYNQTTPPEYSLDMVTAPVVLMYGKNDWLADPEDAVRLGNELPIGAKVLPVPFDDFNHLDFLIGSNCKTLIYDKILRLLPYYRRRHITEKFYSYMKNRNDKDKQVLGYLLNL